MKAILIRRTGGPEVLEVCDVDQPTPGPGQVLVRAEAIGVGWPDILIRSGKYPWMPALPTSPGSDLAGRIEAVGAGVTSLELGQKVLVSARDLAERGGCYVEFIAVPADAPHLLPDTIDLEQAVCLPNYQVAWALLHETAGGRPIRSVFVSGAAGGVGSAVVQLAKQAGMTVIGSVSSSVKAAFARRQGADHTVDHRREKTIERVLELTQGRGVDLVLDHVAGPGFAEHLEMLAPWGTLVSYGALGGMAESDLFRALRKHPAKCLAVRAFSIHAYDHEPLQRRRIMAELVGLLESGAIRPAIADRLAFAAAARAHEIVERGAAMGKVILRPDLDPG